MGQNADFMPLDGWDHVELWVGNAKQGAYFYERAFGFERTAYAGPETGVRDRASYVLEQGDIRFVVTTGLRCDSEVTQFACEHGDAVKDISLRVPDAREAYRQAVQRGARGIAEPHWEEDELGRVELSSIAIYDDVADRVGEIDEDYADLQRLGILADRDDDGYLLQIFTKTAQDRPTLFFEVIERHGARGFGDGNL